MNKVPLNILFDITYGHSLDLSVLEAYNKKESGTINYVSRTEKNNGVSAIVRRIPDIEPFPAGLITVAGSGNSVLEACIQPEPFYTGYHVFVLHERMELSELQKLFYCFCIKQNRYRYNYGRQANRTLGTILIPTDIPKDFESIIPENLVTVSHTNIVSAQLSLAISKWKTFKYGGGNGIFDIKNGYYNKKPQHTTDGNIPFVGSSEFNNGVTEYYTLKEIETNHKDEKGVSHDINQKLFKGNCITVSNNGSVGNAFYQATDFTCSHDVNVLYLKDRPFNKYIALFICTLIGLEKYRWNYGRKWRPIRMPESEIKLPVDKDGKPDYNFMETYIKSLPFSSSI